MYPREFDRLLVSWETFGWVKNGCSGDFVAVQPLFPSPLCSVRVVIVRTGDWYHILHETPLFFELLTALVNHAYFPVNVCSGKEDQPATTTATGHHGLGGSGQWVLYQR